MSADDTIFALASARGRSGVSVIRVSGEKSWSALAAMTPDARLSPPRKMVLRKLIRPSDKSPLDTALVVKFENDESFTGEMSVELHCHGSVAVVTAVLGALSTLGLREAEPGEFTRRAFDNERLDLAQIEGLADLINSETEAQRRAALRQADGSLGRKCRDWSYSLTQSLALLEATIDFADEDIPDTTYDRVFAETVRVRGEIVDLLDHAMLSERLREGWRVALIGAPNAGKSSIINALAKRDVAITSPIAGTTRDTIDVALDLDGYPVTLIDTAGLRETSDVIESEGVARAQQSAKTADLRVALASDDAPMTSDVMDVLRPEDLRVWNKVDLTPAPDGFNLAVSAKDQTGLDALVNQIAAQLSFADPSDASALLRRRHEAALRDTVGSLDTFAELAALSDSAVRDTPEIAAEHLRLAWTALGTITGNVGVESLLDVIFSEFCLGK